MSHSVFRVTPSVWGDNRATLYRCEHDLDGIEIQAPIDGGYVYALGGQWPETFKPSNPVSMMSWRPGGAPLADKIAAQLDDEIERVFCRLVGCGAHCDGGKP